MAKQGSMREDRRSEGEGRHRVSEEQDHGTQRRSSPLYTDTQCNSSKRSEQEALSNELVTYSLVATESILLTEGGLDMQ